MALLSTAYAFSLYVLHHRAWKGCKIQTYNFLKVEAAGLIFFLI